jgi:hypothetical protein
MGLNYFYPLPSYRSKSQKFLWISYKTLQYLYICVDLSFIPNNVQVIWGAWIAVAISILLVFDFSIMFFLKKK